MFALSCASFTWKDLFWRLMFMFLFPIFYFPSVRTLATPPWFSRKPLYSMYS